MKRYFQSIVKDGSPKKRALLPESDDVRQDEKLDFSSPPDDTGKCDYIKKEPLKFLTWNANSLLVRVKNDWQEFSGLVSDFDPDIIALQEVRMPASGLKGGPKNPEEIKDDTSSSRTEKQMIMRALSNHPFKNFRVWWSLADSKYAGTALLIKKCFEPVKISFSLDRAGLKHEHDGRVILAEFDNLYFLNTYVPNNGWKEEENAFMRRRKWDKRMLEFVSQMSDKPLIWCGDLNCSHEEIDVSHPEFFSSAKLNGYVPPNPEDCGQPGFSLNERKRFSAIMEGGQLTDAYRYLHKDKDMDSGFSWSGNPIGKYRGKRMRIDYFLVSRRLEDRIISCRMHGHGIEQQGYCGSDHCPVSLELAP